MHRPLLLATIALFCLPLAAEPRLAAPEYPPYSSASLPAGGSFVELTRSAFATQGYNPDIDFMPWARIRAKLHSGRYQGALPLWPREVREEKLRASRPLFYSQLGLFVRRNTPLVFSSLDDLRGLRVGVVRGYGYPAHITNSGIHIEEAVDDLSNLRKLAAKRFDLVLLERRVGEYLIFNDTNLRDRLVWQEPALESIPLVVGFTAPEAGQPDWAAIFERGLLELHASGEYLRILKRHSEWR